MWNMLLLVLCFFSCSCGFDSTGEQNSNSNEFIPFARDFEGYNAWTNFELTTTSTVSTLIHLRNKRTVYINKLPQKGDQIFEIGTMIVKEMHAAEGDDKKILAMAKQGGTFNAQGARGWRFLELVPSDLGDLIISWQGFGPPNEGSEYGGTHVCSDCHGAARDSNDSVLTPALRLEQF